MDSTQWSYLVYNTNLVLKGYQDTVPILSIYLSYGTVINTVKKSQATFLILQSSQYKLLPFLPFSYPSTRQEKSMELPKNQQFQI
jgi:hypothetical protein